MLLWSVSVTLKVVNMVNKSASSDHAKQFQTGLRSRKQRMWFTETGAQDNHCNRSDTQRSVLLLEVELYYRVQYLQTSSSSLPCLGHTHIDLPRGFSAILW